jgi:endoglucanase
LGGVAMMPVISTQLVSIAVAITSFLLTADSTESMPLRWSDDSIGITSAATACPPPECKIFRSTYPLLYVQLTSSSSLLLAFAEEDAAMRENDAYRLVSLDKTDDMVHSIPQRIGYSSTAVGFDDRTQPLVEHRIHLQLGMSLKNGARYRLEFPGRQLDPVDVSYSELTISPSIQVNQVGYLPGSRKSAYIGNWLGDAGPLMIRQRQFQVIDADSQAVVFEGKLEQSALHDPWSGNDVYRADFSNLQRPGKYYVRVAQLGRSDEFDISKDVYARVYRKTFRLFYHSRNSTAVEAPYAEPGHERPDGIPAGLSGYIHRSVISRSGDSKPAASVYRPMHGGWFDAGDYGQYVVNAAPVWHFYSTGFDIDQNALLADDMQIPESGNGRPDLIDELEWGMQWLQAMQDKTDGGVYSRLVPLRWDDKLPHEVRSRRYLFEKTTHATAAFSAVLSIHSRLLRNEDPDRAAALLHAAEKAWDHASTQPAWPAEGDVYRNIKGVHAGEYPDKSSIDNRLWAAAELYRTTGIKKYYEAFARLYTQIDIDPTAYVSFKDQALAGCWAMLMANGDGREVEPQVVEKLAKHIIDSADWFIRKSDENPYRAPIHQYPGFTGWGSFAQSTRAVIPLLQAYYLTGESVYSERAKEMTNPQLGANPQSISYITGIGKRYPLHPLSKLSSYDANKQPLPGIPVNGPHFHLPALWPSTRSVNNAYHPQEKPGSSPGDADYSEKVFLDAYPALRRYVDADVLPPMSEPTVSEYAQTVIAYGLLGSDKL